MINIEQTKYTPSIKFNSETGIIEIIGDSLPENTFEFYKPLIESVEDYFNSNPKDKTIVNMEITYFNSSTSKLFFDFFDLFEAKNDENIIEINWIHDEEDETMKEAGEEFQEDFPTLNFHLVTK